MPSRMQYDKTSIILGVLSKYWYFFVGLIFLIPIIYRYYQNFVKTQAEKDAEASSSLIALQNKSPVSQKAGLDLITKVSYIQAIAKNTAYHLGTDVLTQEAVNNWLSLDSVKAWASPSAWTENDKDAYLELRKVTNSGQARLIIECYYFITRRDLKNDIKKYLPTDSIKKLPLFN